MKFKLHFLFSLVAFVSTSLTASLMGQSGIVVTGITPPITAVDPEGNTVSLINGDTIQKGWTIRSGSDSGIMFKFPTGEILSMDGNSDVTILGMDPVTIDLKNGRVTNKSVEGREFAVKTPYGFVSSDSSEEGIFSVETNPSDKTDVSLLQGSVRINGSSLSDFVLSDEPDAPGGPKQPRKTSIPGGIVKNLSDAEIVEIAAKMEMATLMIAQLQGNNFITTVPVFNDPTQLLEVSESL